MKRRDRSRVAASTYQAEYVRAPRAVAAAWWTRPWTEVKDAGQRGEDGLSMVGLDDARTGTGEAAYLTQGQGKDWTDKTVLFRRNW